MSKKIDTGMDIVIIIVPAWLHFFQWNEIESEKIICNIFYRQIKL